MKREEVMKQFYDEFDNEEIIEVELMTRTETHREQSISKKEI